METIINSLDLKNDFKYVSKYFTEHHSGTYNPGDLRNVWVSVTG